MSSSAQVVMHGAVVPARSNRAIQVILWSWLVAGVLDGTDAVIFNSGVRGVSVMRIFQFIASGLLGLKAFRGGWGTASLGVLLHFLIALSAAVVYYLLARTYREVRNRPLLWGPVFGVAVFLVMHYVVVPLSAVPRQSSTHALDYINLVFSHVFFVGLPIALVNARRSRG